MLLTPLSLGVLISHAQTVVSWNGGNGNWSTATDWSGGVVPNNGVGHTYHPIIDNNGDVALDLSIVVSDLTVGTSGRLDGSGNNSLTIAPAGIFTNRGALTFGTDLSGSNVLSIQQGGRLINFGNVSASGMASGVDVTGTTTNNAGATIDLENVSGSTFAGNVNSWGTFKTGTGANVTVTGTFANKAGAQFIVRGNYPTGDVAQVNALNNFGYFLADGGILKVTGNVTNGGTFISGLSSIGGNGQVSVGGSFTNTASGTVTLQHGVSFITVGGAMTNSGVVQITRNNSPGTGLTAARYTQRAGMTAVTGMLAAGVVTVTGGTIQAYNAPLGGDLTLGGSGVAPTVEVGRFVTLGSFTESSTGTLKVDIGGSTPGLNQGQLQVQGAARLSGKLTATLTPRNPAWTPAIGQTFTILIAKSVSGTFSNSTIPINSSEHFVVSYTPTSVVLNVVSGAA